MVRKNETKTQEGRSESQLTFQRYLGLSLVIILLLVLMFIITNLELFIREREEILDSERYFDLEQNIGKGMLEREGLDSLYFTLVVDKPSLVEDGLKKAKIPHSVVSSLKDIKQTKDNLILDGDMIKDDKDLKVLKKFIAEKKTILFLSMPNEKFIKELEIREILGIGQLIGEKSEKTLTLVPGFILGGVHELKSMIYKIYDVELLYSTKVFGYGKKNSPIIWRNIYQGSEIYVINASFMNTNASYGILSALMSQIHEDYIYPVVNARLMTYEGFPYITDENKDKLEEFYNRDAMKFQNDILLPNILTINKRRQFIPNGYFRVGFKERYKDNIEDYIIKEVGNVDLQMFKDGGETGVRYSGDAEYDKKMYSEVFNDEEIKSIFIDKETRDMKKIVGISDSLESVIGPWEGKKGFEYIDKDVVYIPLTVDGIDNKGQKELEFLSGVTAFGAIVQNLDVEDFVLLKGDKENWTKSSRSYIKFIDKYREKFSFLEDKNITKASNSVKVFRNSSPKIKISSNKIQMKFDNWIGESHFILRTDKIVGDVVNGKVEKIESGTYLVTALDKNVEIEITKPQNTNMSR